MCGSNILQVRENANIIWEHVCLIGFKNFLSTEYGYVSHRCYVVEERVKFG
jgi:hypothetical protein